MKNIVLILVVAACAAAAYFYLSNSKSTDDSQADLVTKSSGTNVVKTPAAASEALASLVSTAPENARVYIIEPGNGAVVSSPVTIKFGIENMVVAKAGDNQENSGHHHLLIDLDELPDMSVPLPASEQIVHFGGAQTETVTELEAGEHTLQLLLGNYLHIPHDQPVLSEKITITVQ